MSCLLLPLITAGLGGNTAIETKLVPDTVMVSEALTEPDVAVTVAVPFAVAVTKPVLLTVTVAGEAVHKTLLVKSWVVPSLKVPVAPSC